MKNKTSDDNSSEQIRKREKTITGFIIVISIIIGVLITFILAGLMEYFN